MLKRLFYSLQKKIKIVKPFLFLDYINRISTKMKKVQQLMKIYL